MEQIDMFSARIRWVAIATGIAGALALLPLLFFLYPALLIVGGIVQPRFPTTGKWFVWAGAAGLWVLVIVYDVMMFPHPFRRPDFPEYMVLTFSATTVLLIWCSAELAANGLKRVRARRSLPPAEPRAVRRGVWSFAVVLNLLLGWGVAGWLAPSWYRYSVIFYVLSGLMNQAGIIVVAFDIFLIWRVVRLRRWRAGSGNWGRETGDRRDVHLVRRFPPPCP